MFFMKFLQFSRSVMSDSLGSGRSPGEGNGNLLRYFCLGNPMDRGAWWTTVQGGRKRVKYNVETENIMHTTKWKAFDIVNH